MRPTDIQRDRGGCRRERRAARAGAWACLVLAMASGAAAAAGAEPAMRLRAWGVPEYARNDVEALADRKIVEAFQERFPNVKPVATTGLEIPGRQTKDILPLMQIAGDIAPDVLYVNFRQSDTFIRNKFLYPLDRYLEHLVGATVRGGHLLAPDAYVAQLRQGPNFAREVAERVPDQCWPVMRRRCPYGAECPYLKTWGEAPAEVHYHTWCFPVVR